MATVTCKSFVHDVDKVHIVRDKLPNFLHQEIVFCPTMPAMHPCTSPSWWSLLRRKLLVDWQPQFNSCISVATTQTLTCGWVFYFNHDFQSFRCTVYKACKRSWCWGFSCTCFLCQGLPPVQGVLLQRTTFIPRIIPQSLATLMADMSRSTVSGEVPSTSKVTGRTKTEVTPRSNEARVGIRTEFNQEGFRR